MKAPAFRAGNPRAKHNGLWSRLRRGLSRSHSPDNAQEKHGQTDALRAAGMHSFVHAPGKPVWMGRDYARFADEGYVRNVIAHRAVGLVAGAAAHVPWRLFDRRDGGAVRLHAHPVLKLLTKPNPFQGGAELFESLYAYRLIAGNAYLQAAGPKEGAPMELYSLRPDRVSVIAGHHGHPAGYRYTLGDSYTDYPLDRLNGRSKILHLKEFHPLNDWYGLSPIEAAAYSIDQHNQAGAWNQALLQNGARPSGALVVKTQEQGGSDTLSDEQYQRIRQQMDDQFSGAGNAGRPLLLEGGLDWREMSLSPREMDFIEAKNSAARDIALAFGVPPQLLGIPGDNTYSNLAEARLALWEQTILPLVDSMCDALNNWLLVSYGEGLELGYDTDNISALSTRREQVWERVNGASFLTDEEKRELVGMKR
jgi:HK97 family phage portal protein